jgi:hypothetical protein
MKPVSPRSAAFESAMELAQNRFADGDAVAAWKALERAHVLGQTRFGPHLRTHAFMLRVGFALRDWHEVRGQILRIALVPVGHLAGRLPRGNTGRSRVSAFAPMQIPPDVEQLLADEN